MVRPHPSTSLKKKKVPQFHRFFLVPWLAIATLFIGCILTVVVIKWTQSLRQYAAGNTVFASPGDNLQSKAQSLQPGDTLILHDGTYNGSIALQGLQGTQAAPITVEAEHDGKAIIDGGGSGNPLLVNNSTYVTVEGLIARNGQEPVVVTGKSDHVILRRITASNAAEGNWHIFDVKFGPTNVLLEDCAGWGRGRYVFIAYHANNVTFRRTWAKWTTQSNFSPAPRSCYGVYGSSNVTLENAICWNAFPEQPSTDFFTGQWQTSDGPATDNISYYGVMFFDNWEGLLVNDLSQSKNTIIKDSYFENNNAQGQYTTNRIRGDGVAWHIANTGTISNITTVNNATGVSATNGNPTVSNSVFLNNKTGISGTTNESSNDFWQNGSAGGGNGAGDKAVDPGYNTAKYGKGAYLFVPPGSPLQHAGQNGADIGANILYEYVNGQLTNTPLWPWPMEDRIKAETGASVTWENGGGFWKTLDGVYPSSSQPAPSMPLITPVYNCLGACPTLGPSMPPATSASPQISPLISAGISSVPSTIPVLSPSISQQQPHSNTLSGWFAVVIAFILQILRMLLHFLLIPISWLDR